MFLPQHYEQTMNSQDWVVILALSFSSWQRKRRLLLIGRSGTSIDSIYKIIEIAYKGDYNLRSYTPSLGNKGH